MERIGVFEGLRTKQSTPAFNLDYHMRVLQRLLQVF